MLTKEDAIGIAKYLAKEKGHEMVIKEKDGNYKVYTRQFGVEVAYVSPNGTVTEVPSNEDRIQP